MSIVAELTELVERRMADVMVNALFTVELETQRAAPEQTGLLQRQIQARPLDLKGPVLEGEIIADTPYAGYTDAGTRGPYVIMPRRAKALRWEDGSGVHFAKKVVHPGLRARRWFNGGDPGGEPMALRWRDALQRAMNT